jgi:16S rRNA (guanine(966)-N(2))-methyltransferase RsmD
MRVITGSLKGRVIPFDVAQHGEIRVTSGRVKKAAFSILGEALADVRFLDLCAGSGQIGLEAVSRGARVLMNEPDKTRLRFIDDLVQSWNVRASVKLFGLSAERLVNALSAGRRCFEIVYLDPPYRDEIDGRPISIFLLNQLAATSLLADSGRVLVQHPGKLDMPESVHRLVSVKRRRYGDTALTLYKTTPQGLTFRGGN